MYTLIVIMLTVNAGQTQSADMESVGPFRTFESCQRAMRNFQDQGNIEFRLQCVAVDG